MMMSAAHIPVLCQDTVSAVCGRLTSGIFVDATFGRGGHSAALLARLDANSRVLAFDKDLEALAVGQKMAEQDSRLTLIHASFAELKMALARFNVHQVDGIMADLGVSSPQLDESARGFSFMQSGPLDMRMNTSKGLTAAEWLAQIDEESLANVLYQYGEERYSRRIARAIKQAGPLTSTGELAEVVKVAHPKWEKHKHPATRSFQAIRIAVNHELDDISAFLPQTLDVLKVGARLAIISFHSLEDRLIKQFIQHASGTTGQEDAWSTAPVKTLKKIARIAPGEAEIKDNPRARSAWLRVAERVGPLS